MALTGIAPCCASAPPFSPSSLCQDDGDSWLVEKKKCNVSVLLVEKKKYCLCVDVMHEESEGRVVTDAVLAGRSFSF